MGNIRLSYSDLNGDGDIDVTGDPMTTEILEENNYYPFGLRHRGYNEVVSANVNSVASKFKYNGVELEESLGLNLYEMDWRQYDPAIGRFTQIDPITHFHQSTYTAFDNNPIYWTDPSGTTSVQDLIDQARPGVKYTTNGDGTFTGDGHTIGEKEDPQEGTTRPQMVGVPRGGAAPHKTKRQHYHAGGLGKAGWYNEDDYYNLYRTTIRAIGQGQSSIEVLGSFNFTDDVLLKMASWAMSAYDYYGGQIPKALGNIKEDNIIFELLLFKAPVSKVANLGKMSFWSGHGTELAAKRAGFTVLGATRAGKNMIELTSGMSRAQSGPFWDRLSAALARTFKKGSTANVYLSRSYMKTPGFKNSTWMRIEKPILEANGVKIKYNYID